MAHWAFTRISTSLVVSLLIGKDISPLQSAEWRIFFISRMVVLVAG